MFGHLTIGKKMIFGFAVLVLALALVVTLSYTGVTRIVKNAEEVIYGNKLDALITQKEVDHLKWVNKVNALLTDENITTLDVQTDDHKCAFGQWLYSDSRLEAEEKIPQLATILKKLEAPHHGLHQSAINMEQAFNQENPSQDKMALAQEVYNSQTLPSLHEVQTLLADVRRTVEESIMTDEAMLNSAQTSKAAVGIVGIIGVLLGLAAAIVVTVGTVRALKNVIDELRMGAEQVASAAGQVSAASQSLAQGATEQAAGLEETSSSLEEMASMTRKNAENAQQANTLADKARKATEGGTESMKKMHDAIEQIQDSSNETANIIKVIDEIAFQTNLLALNAAVEAARAGEAGKGFAVVAEEVRNLAIRSAEAAKNTSELIQESVKNSKNGVDITSEVAKVLEEIRNQVAKTSELIAEITAASGEQTQGIEQVNSAIAQMDKVTQQNAANAEESASASEQLTAQAQQTNELVARLSAMVGAHGDNSPSYLSQNARSGKSKPRMNLSDKTFHNIAGTTSFKATARTGDSHANVEDCWEVKKCGRTPGGNKVGEFGVCPAYPNEGKNCWNVAGTFCGGKVQGTSADKRGGCLVCNFYKTLNTPHTAGMSM